MTAQDRSDGQHRAGAVTVVARPGRQQFQGGSSRAVSAGDGGRAYCRAGAERHGRGESGRFAAGAGAVAGHRPIVEIDARLGDEVKKGQLLFKVRSTDIAGAFSDYRKAVRTELRTDVDQNPAGRAKLLFENGAIPKSALEIAQNAEGRQRWKCEVDTEPKEHLRLLGSDPDHPTGIVEVFAPVPGTITDQQITDQSGVQALTPPNPFTISDMSHVWIICDV